MLRGFRCCPSCHRYRPPGAQRPPNPTPPERSQDANEAKRSWQRRSGGGGRGGCAWSGVGGLCTPGMHAHVVNTTNKPICGRMPSPGTGRVQLQPLPRPASSTPTQKSCGRVLLAKIHENALLCSMQMGIFTACWLVRVLVTQSRSRRSFLPIPNQRWLQLSDRTPPQRSSIWSGPNRAIQHRWCRPAAWPRLE